jgi:ribonucleotide monophosphatase NagD (HAD superfamily)
VRDDIVMIGDRIETDIRFGIANRWRTVLVLTGVATAGEGSVSGADDVVQSIADVPALLAGR